MVAITRGRDIDRRYAMGMGLAFLLLGILGFIDPLVMDGRLFGIFAVNAAHNWVHLLSGLLGVWAAVTTVRNAALGYAGFLVVAYGLVTLLGFAMGRDSGMVMNAIHVNMADNVLHLLITLSAIAVIAMSRRRNVFPGF